ncbi:MAG: hypothetical protein II743_01320 [Lachnospiraceae bacterium]|nr:hypothetical protein [Lachnospiraceae bacterium]
MGRKSKIVIACGVGLVAAALVWKPLYYCIMNQPVAPLAVTEETAQPSVEPEVIEVVEESVEVAQISLTEELKEAESSEEAAEETIGYSISTGEIQGIQETPEIPDVPSETPELEEGADLTNPDKVPEYKEQKKPEEKPADTVVTKKSQEEHGPGAIWLEGFGWIEYSGPNHGEYAEDMYMNGNKIGDM